MFNDDRLRAICLPFGEVISANVMWRKNQQNNQVGFVEMRSRHECMRIIQALDGHTVQGKNQKNCEASRLRHNKSVRIHTTANPMDQCTNVVKNVVLET